MPAIRVTPWAKPRDLAEIGHCLYDTGAAAAIAAAGDEDEEVAIQAQIQTDQQLLERGCNFVRAIFFPYLYCTWDPSQID